MRPWSRSRQRQAGRTAAQQTTARTLHERASWQPKGVEGGIGSDGGPRDGDMAKPTARAGPRAERGLMRAPIATADPDQKIGSPATRRPVPQRRGLSLAVLAKWRSERRKYCSA